jgi:hypothetical protein
MMALLGVFCTKIVANYKNRFDLTITRLPENRERGFHSALYNTIYVVFVHFFVSRKKCRPAF